MNGAGHRAVLAALPATTKARLTGRRDGPALRRLAGQSALIALCMGWIAAQAPLWPAVVPLLGVLMSFLFALSHECTHATAFRRGWLNEAVGRALALPLMLPFVWFRYFHFAHHRHTNDPARDPELAGGPRPETPFALLVYLSGWTYWRGAAGVLLSHAASTITEPYLPARQHAAMRREARMLLALYGLIFASLLVSPLAFWLWMLPMLLGQPVLRLFLLAEHGGCPPVADMLENSRTTRTGAPLRWLAWNMPFHAEHHAMPAVPFHRLPDLHAELAPHLKTLSPGYAAFAAGYVANLRQVPDQAGSDTSPPPTAAATPVVDGAEVGNPRATRTAR